MSDLTKNTDYAHFTPLHHRGYETGPGFIQVPSSDSKGKPFKISARTPQQGEMVYALSRMSYLTAVIGAAGAGKTLFGVATGIAGLTAGLYEHVVITRPMVEAEETSGALPGGELQKIAPMLMPIFENMIMIGHGNRIAELDDIRRDADKTIGAQLVESMTKPLQIAPLGKMRGRTFNDSFVILDEAQNTTENQMKMFLTRIGKNSRAYICGDLTQVDDKFNNGNNGLKYLIKLIEKTSSQNPLLDGAAHVGDFYKGSNTQDHPANDEMHLIDVGSDTSQRGPGVNRVLSWKD
ncbi:MAG: phosphate starvation-inducible PhoH-like protein [Alphaproteobacteria bacterium]|jgi:phosphate starvation-inducible PhoH-like protein